MATHVVVQLGNETYPFPANVSAADVMMGVTGSSGGSLRHVNGTMYAGGMLVPAGQYQVVAPQGETLQATTVAR